MANLFNLVLSSSDDDEEQFRRRSKFKQRINYFDELDDIEFKMRFRLNKQSVLLILEEIRQVLEFVTNRNNAISPMEQLLLTLRMYATGSFLITMGDFSDFYNIARFPRVIGCIDCTHVRVQSFGGENAELFLNRKDYFSLNVQTVCNSNLEITNVVARWQGSVHDSTIFNNSRLRANFEDGAYGNGLLLGDSA
ncbi:PREDICTED: putative nuclease HARBI1 [Trachymyrmex cornetzi]|uniref:putative nuclease HARBI1 n=1 Tax=Trachymyrmex cornetzi TaxID=471704 RepID=UPI00084F5226|nr:PREDICTED: putative nuclease HARBI1 [Trachymyrmex cornetzi]